MRSGAVLNGWIDWLDTRPGSYPGHEESRPPQVELHPTAQQLDLGARNARESQARRVASTRKMLSTRSWVQIPMKEHFFFIGAMVEHSSGDFFILWFPRCTCTSAYSIENLACLMREMYMLQPFCNFTSEIKTGSRVLKRDNSVQGPTPIAVVCHSTLRTLQPLENLFS